MEKTLTTCQTHVTAVCEAQLLHQPSRWARRSSATGFAKAATGTVGACLFQPPSNEPSRGSGGKGLRPDATPDAVEEMALPAVQPDPEREPDEGTVSPEQARTAGSDDVSPEQQVAAVQSDGTEPGLTEPGRQAENADQSSTVPNEVFPSQSADEIEAISADSRLAERRYRSQAMAAPGAGSTVDMSAAPPSEPDVYVPVSSRVDIAQFTHAASSNALLETQNAGPAHFRGRLTAAKKTDTLQQN
eukprot:COSAG02_NODE_9229_length_2283_cov_1.529304_2_plen_244_part_01